MDTIIGFALGLIASTLVDYAVLVCLKRSPRLRSRFISYLRSK